MAKQPRDYTRTYRAFDGPSSVTVKRVAGTYTVTERDNDGGENTYALQQAPFMDIIRRTLGRYSRQWRKAQAA